MTLAEHVERYVTFPLPRMELAPGVESIQSASRSRAAEPARPTTAPRDTTRAAASPIALRDGPRQRGLSPDAAPGAADKCSPRSPVELKWGRPRKLARNSAGDH